MVHRHSILKRGVFVSLAELALGRTTSLDEHKEVLQVEAGEAQAKSRAGSLKLKAANLDLRHCRALMSAKIGVFTIDP